MYDCCGDRLCYKTFTKLCNITDLFSFKLFFFHNTHSFMSCTAWHIFKKMLSNIYMY